MHPLVELALRRPAAPLSSFFSSLAVTKNLGRFTENHPPADGSSVEDDTLSRDLFAQTINVLLASWKLVRLFRLNSFCNFVQFSIHIVQFLHQVILKG